MAMIDLSELTKGGRFRSLSGFQLGREAREHFQVDQLDKIDQPVAVAVPEHVFNIAPSFFQGMFAASLKRFKTADSFLGHYRFNADPVVMRQVIRGINACLNKRDAIAGL